jgi:hypothetical protein
LSKARVPGCFRWQESSCLPSASLRTRPPGFGPLLWSGPAKPFWPATGKRKMYRPPPGHTGRRKICGGLRWSVGKLHFCSTNHLAGNKISLPALPDFNAGKLLFLRPSFYRLPTFGLFSDRIGWPI